MQDIKIARNAHAEQPGNSIAGVYTIPVLPANPNRYSISIAWLFEDFSSGSAHGHFYARIGGKRWPLAVLSLENPSAIVNLVDAGQAVCGEVWWELTGGGAPTAVYIAEAAFDTTIEEAAK